MAAAAVFKVVGLLILVFTAATFSASGTAAATWCVARSDASEQALQTALDYACGAGADCAPIQSSGLCYLPNTVQAHASYAFNSYYQRKANAPDSCSFAGTSAIAKTDPSYGSCVYPSSPRAMTFRGFFYNEHYSYYVVRIVKYLVLELLFRIYDMWL
ncbi:hypothetical protein ABFS83_14G036300 [Erythranthe nasuta]